MAMLIVAHLFVSWLLCGRLFNVCKVDELRLVNGSERATITSVSCSIHPPGYAENVGVILLIALPIMLISSKL